VRFDCEQCKSKYSIEDARVRGKVLKIRCKNCGNVITVREPAAGSTATPAAVSGVAGEGPAPSAPSPPAQRAAEAVIDDEGDRTVFSAGPPPTAAEPEWFISCDGQQEGPFSAERAAQRAREEMARGGEIHAWQEGFADWLPIGQVPELTRLLRAAPSAPPAPRPRVPTPAPAPVKESPAARGGEDSRLHPRSSIPMASAAPVKSGPVRAKEEPREETSSPWADALRNQAEERGATARPAPSEPKGGREERTSGERAAVPRRKETPAPARESSREPSMDQLPQRVPHTGEEEGLTPLPTPAFYSGEFPLDELEGRGEPAEAPSQGGGGMFPASDPNQELLISDPSVMVKLPVMAELARQEISRPVEVPPAPAAEPEPEPAPRRRGGVIVAGIVAAGALGLVAYLALGRGSGGTTDPQRVSRTIDDTPVELRDTLIVTGGAPRGQGGNGKGAGAAGSNVGSKAPHDTQVTATKPGTAPGDVPGPKIQRGSLTAPSVGQVAGEGRSLERTPTDLTESQGGKVNPEDMLRVVRQNKKSVELCYERGLKFDSNLKGKVEVELKVGISGRVTDVKLSDPAIAASQLGMCLSQTIKRWTFPASGSEYNFSFPLILQSN
jgi:predicted Zn finger-like uncharacterized protein